ncbi:hypothetical protein ACP70R_030519 [Stipagrostis hirtigluma subsp. patula]
MDPSERSKKSVQPWIGAAVLHFSLCFAVGALAACALLVAGGSPSAVSIRSSFFSLPSNTQRVAPAPVPDLGLLLIVTVTAPDGGMAQEASLARLGHTLRQVAPPLLWIVVGAENRTVTARAVQVLRGTGVMFRHLTYDARNFTDAGDEADRQRNVALSHIERHRLNGVVHFAGASGVYNLRFFQELRQTRGLAAWPVATISPADQRVTVEGPTCNLSQITGWYTQHSCTNGTQRTYTGAVDTSVQTSAGNRNSSSEPPRINISGLGFRSPMLWDSERPSTRNSSENATQDFIQLIRQMVTEDEIKLKGLPCDCSESQIRQWHLEMPRFTPKTEEKETPQNQTQIQREGDDLMT